MTPFDEGFKAFRSGQLGNPYHKNTVRNRDWELGFNKAYFINLERVKERELGKTQKATS